LLRAKLSRTDGRPKNDEIRSYIFRCLDDGKKSSEIIGQTVNGTKISKTTYYRIIKEWKER
jgi:DNA invertase Pin-like site-specific DNA recombinase